MTATDKEPEKHRMELPESLRKKRDKLAEEYKDFLGSGLEVMGFNACWTELQPVVEALKLIGEEVPSDYGPDYVIESLYDRVHTARQALQSLEGEKTCPPHSWDDSGENCNRCGTKDWMT
jgi:hypothetical protein